MKIIKNVFLILKELTTYFIQFIKAFMLSKSAQAKEIVALRSQLAQFKEKVINKKITMPKVTNGFRVLWLFLSKFFKNWKTSLVIVKPETVVSWHRKIFKFIWKVKSKRGRPKISREIIALIKKIHKENPLLSPEKIHERLKSLNISDAPCPNTIAKYINHPKKGGTQKQIQSWKSFLKNHASGIWAMDIFVVPSLFFKVLYALVIINHERRVIEHVAVTENLSGEWVVQQLREAMPYDKYPKYLIHDNDPVFKNSLVESFLNSSNVKIKRTGVKAPWQNSIAERQIGITRAELTNHIIPINQQHLLKLLREYSYDYFNTVRTHQGINCEVPIPKAESIETKIKDTALVSRKILNGLYTDYQKIA